MVALWQMFALSMGVDAEQTLMQGYRQTYPDGCAETGGGKPNLNCSLVKAHVCLAYDGLLRLLAETGHSLEATPHRQTAIAVYGCQLRENSR